ncbi:nucleotide exchange factor GrpE [Alicyclobacillus acidoterrestris]|uniref:nucleotide exchange factor GrpE n=1 Tax=Alicyclobacillus acidoterrestris TaxID=1450 RepID=UPI0006873D13
MFRLSEEANEQVQNEAATEAETDVEAKEAQAETETASNDAAQSEAQVDPKDQEIADLQQQLLRTRADFDNFRRRTRAEKEELSQFATKKLLSDLLPVVDNFDRAMQAVSDADEQIRTGIEMVHRQFQAILSQYGVTPMNAEGEAFDPTRHEAVMQEAAEGVEPNVVLQELQRGYLLHDKVLRPAMVKVSV